jgi:hypothetical protein
MAHQLSWGDDRSEPVEEVGAKQSKTFLQGEVSPWLDTFDFMITNN